MPRHDDPLLPRQSYYGAGEQPWDTIQKFGWDTYFAAGNVLKYLRRAKPGEDPAERHAKARWYMRALIAKAGESPHSYAAAILAQLVGELSSEERAIVFKAA